MPHSFNRELKFGTCFGLLIMKNNFPDFSTGSGISELPVSLVKGFVSLLCNLFEGSFIT
jgi:hypothetical protein